ncbi:MAG: Alkylhydroperoxidase family enzyme, contains CxxC motif [Chloroflexi bacterium]|nr:MAG: Alkylhydroperoxidase family enzyme, contains CxxC motif [Chloroflexota bacterium]
MSHGEFLRLQGDSDASEVAKVANNWRTAELDAKERAMLEFSERLTFTPGLMSPDDLDGLRAVGFDEAQILAIVAAAAYRNFVSRIAELLGVDLPDEGYSKELLEVFPSKTATSAVEEAIQ